MADLLSMRLRWVDDQGRLTLPAYKAMTAFTAGGVVSVGGTAPISSTGGTTPQISITPATTLAAGSLSAADKVKLDNTSGVNTGDQSSVTGNAGTATALQTSRNINGVAFNGTADITVAAAAGTLTGATLAAGVTASSLTSVGTLVNLTVTNPITGSVTGNAATTTALQTARNINGVSFNGTADITVTAAASTLTGAWQTYTPTVTSETGTITTASATGRYLQVGKVVFLQIKVTITTNGTGATSLRATIPGLTPAGDTRILAGKEVAVDGSSLAGVLVSGGSFVSIYKYNNTYPGSDGAVCVVSGQYEIA